MALIVGSQLTTLAEDIVPAAPGGASSEQIAARDAAVVNTENLVTKICQYLVDKMEIKGITVTNDTGQDANTRAASIITAGVPVPTDGGLALKTTMLVPASIPSVDNATQSNDGFGRVS